MQDVDFRERVSGKSYVNLLEDIHKKTKPTTYFEIGVQFGDTIKLAECATIGVDPRFRCETNIIGGKPICQLFQQTSDVFFENHNPSTIFGRSIDLAFLDGMHLFEFLLRDFINTEKHCAPDSVIALHDCLPPGFYMTSRDMADANHPHSAFPGWWAGDVWKMIPTLQKYRPDLSLTIIDSAPTGLVLITRLDPSDNTLSENYGKIIADFQAMDRDEFTGYWSRVQVTSTDRLNLTELRLFK
ncbi:class I SAM-dependent methyltransferase [Mesorhizobium sp. BH1-1-5]|uniref:class I SAM-dependent methyltransferase n=1 Tax=Mesorhizobium sp. BH1-1-5 TaxID=2876661 RepID=UPI001CCF94D2|nr:class I SAM-dependent methyltransferase [Mesorhizobium sp. BH1-1-5]MBZ9990507.1 class I SAM-dependent methyltransferase [Mesorhizobium sp. BH1-1-5]